MNKKSPQKYKNNFLEKVKIETELKNTKYEKEKFMEHLKDNLQFLEYLSSDKLEKILQYYLEENKRKKEILKKLKVYK